MSGSHVAASRRRTTHPPTQRGRWAVGVAAAVVLGAGWWAAKGGVGAPAPAVPGPRPVAVALSEGPGRSPAGDGVEVLRAWDRARAAAYAAGSVTALRRLYGGGAGASDVRVLQSYLRRGYRVEGMRMQLIAVSVLRREPGGWRLRVTDRLAGGAAVGYGERLALPRDRASTRTVRLERAPDGRWRVVPVSG